MNAPTAVASWQNAWIPASVSLLAMAAWRGVEAQHVVSTMRLVDTLDEQAELERILERSKPALPRAQGGSNANSPSTSTSTPAATAAPVHYLLSTPFRYRPLHASRFRKAGTLGLWYGAATLQTACAEVAYWRWRFLMDSAALAHQALHTEHTFFQAQLQGLAIDLSQAPWSSCRPAWTQSSDYSATQAVAQAAREHQVQWIRYESVRDAGGLCAAVLDLRTLRVAQRLAQQTWHCKTTRSTVLMVHGADRFSWSYDN